MKELQRQNDDDGKSGSISSRVVYSSSKINLIASDSESDEYVNNGHAAVRNFSSSKTRKSNEVPQENVKNVTGMIKSQNNELGMELENKSFFTKVVETKPVRYQDRTDTENNNNVTYQKFGQERELLRSDEEGNADYEKNVNEVTCNVFDTLSSDENSPERSENSLNEYEDPFSDNKRVSLHSSSAESSTESQSYNDNDNSSSNNSITSPKPPPLPPRGANYQTPQLLPQHQVQYTTSSEHLISSRLSSNSSQCHVQNALDAKTGKSVYSETRLKDVEMQIPDIHDFSRSVPMYKHFKKSSIFIGAGTTRINLCGDYLCAVGSTVKIYRISTAELVMHFNVVSLLRNNSTTQGTNFKVNFAISIENPFKTNYDSLHSKTDTHSTHKNKQHLPRKQLVNIVKATVVNNDLTNLMPISNIFSENLHKKDNNTHFNQIKKERCTAAIFLEFKCFKSLSRYLILGTEKGSVLCVDIEEERSCKLNDKKPAHVQTIVSIVKLKGFVCILDACGVFSIWELKNTIMKQVNSFKIPSTGTYELNGIIDKIDAHANGEFIYVIFGKVIVSVGFDDPNKPKFKINGCKELGNATSISSFSGSCIIVGHDDGKVTIWDPTTLSLIKVYALGPYGICSLDCVGDNMVWIAYLTGKMHIYHVEKKESIRWTLVNTFSAHASANIVQILQNRALLLTKGNNLVATLSETGIVKFWDGFFAENYLNSLLLSHEDKFCKYTSVKVLVCSWNVNAIRPSKIVGDDRSQFDEWLNSAEDPDIVVVCIQEIVDLESKKVNAKKFLSKSSLISNFNAPRKMSDTVYVWERALESIVCTPANKLKLVRTTEMVGLFQIMFAKAAIIKYIKNVAVSRVKTGFKGYHGNKGAIALRFKIESSPMCFVNCHLTAHQENVYSRNKDINNIFRYCKFPSDKKNSHEYAPGGDGSFITDHGIIFWAGDLNYRINLDRNNVIRLVKSQAWNTLLKSEQLTLQRGILPGFGLRAFHEGNLFFPPTFKYDIGSNDYDTSDKKRVPSWCDRIFYFGKKVQLHTYKRFEVKSSDHRPISAAFTVPVKKIDLKDYSGQMQESNITMDKHFLRYIHNEKIKWIVSNFSIPHGDCEKYLEMHKGDLISSAEYIVNEKNISETAIQV